MSIPPDRRAPWAAVDFGLGEAMRPILASFVFICAAAPLHAANWDQFLKASFGAADVGEGSACYARVYDAKHLAAHKGQRIGDVAVRLVMRRENGNAASTGISRRISSAPSSFIGATARATNSTG